MAFASDKTRQGAAGVSSGGYEIDNSLRFNDDDSAYLSKSFSTPTNQKKWTYSGWFKRSNIDKDNEAGITFLTSGSDMTNFASLYIIEEVSNRDLLRLGFRTSGDWNSLITIGDSSSSPREFRDVSSWYHLVCSVDTSLSEAADRIKMYINGVEVATHTGAGVGEPAEDYLGYINKSGQTHYIGKDHTGVYTDGYLAEVHFIDGTALDPTSFGETGDYGEWKPIEVSGLTYGNNGFYLDFKLSAATSSGLGNDASSNSNNWTPSNLASTDQMVDTPTNNFCTLNPLDNYGAKPLSEGNLKCTGSVSTCFNTATFWFQTGKWYFESLVTAIGSGSGDGFRVGFSNAACRSGVVASSNIAWTLAYLSDGKAWDGETELSGAASYVAGDIIAMAIDLDAGTPTLKMYKNNVLQITRNISAAFQDVPLSPFIGDQEAGTIGGVMNFGQDSSFAGNKTAQSNQDSNGIGDFYYEPPTGFLALCTSNLPAVAVVPSEHFNTVLYDGDGSTQSIPNVSTSPTSIAFQPDLVWIKARNYTYGHGLWDVVRGTTKRLASSETGAELTWTDSITSFDTNGFTTGSNNDLNNSGRPYVAWNWKANGSGSLNEVGSIDSTVSVNTDAGFSIVGYTGNGTNPATVGHGLSSAPEMIIIKKRSVASDWTVYHAGIASDAETDFIELNSTGAASDDHERWNDTAPSNTVWTMQDRAEMNGSGGTFIAYCFHSVDGYSKVGSYTGNGVAGDGAFVYLGFRPKWVLIKRSNSAGQAAPIFDSVRSGYNIANKGLKSNSANAEITTDGGIDILSNGFKANQNDGEVNSSGGIYIYLAFAETPFKHSNAR